jgi:hypothetical protein
MADDSLPWGFAQCCETKDHEDSPRREDSLRMVSTDPGSAEHQLGQTISEPKESNGFRRSPSPPAQGNRSEAELGLGARAPISARIRGVQVPTQAEALRPGIRAQLRRREVPWRAGGGELVARRRTNVIRPDGPVSKRARANLPRRSLIAVRGSMLHADGLPIQACSGTIGWLTTGQREGACRGLGIPAGSRASKEEPAGGRGVVVPMKPVKAGGWEGRQCGGYRGGKTS